MTSPTARRLVKRAIPTMPEVITARHLAENLPYLGRSTIDEALRELSSEVMVWDSSSGKCYSRYIEGSLY